MGCSIRSGGRYRSARVASEFSASRNSAFDASQPLLPLVRSFLPPPPVGHTPSYIALSFAGHEPVVTPQTARAAESSISAALMWSACTLTDEGTGDSRARRT